MESMDISDVESLNNELKQSSYINDGYCKQCSVEYKFNFLY